MIDDMTMENGPNLPDSPRRFLLHQYTAADAWPLLGVEDYAVFRSNLVSGEEAASPRMESLPLTMTYPEALHQGSIYENQRVLGKRFFFDKATPKK